MTYDLEGRRSTSWANRDFGEKWDLNPYLYIHNITFYQLNYFHFFLSAGIEPTFLHSQYSVLPI